MTTSPPFPLQTLRRRHDTAAQRPRTVSSDHALSRAATCWPPGGPSLAPADAATAPPMPGSAAMPPACRTIVLLAHHRIDSRIATNRRAALFTSFPVTGCPEPQPPLSSNHFSRSLPIHSPPPPPLHHRSRLRRSSSMGLDEMVMDIMKIETPHLINMDRNCMDAIPSPRPQDGAGSQETARRSAAPCGGCVTASAPCRRRNITAASSADDHFAAAITVTVAPHPPRTSTLPPGRTDAHPRTVTRRPQLDASVNRASQCCPTAPTSSSRPTRYRRGRWHGAHHDTAAGCGHAPTTGSALNTASDVMSLESGRRESMMMPRRFVDHAADVCLAACRSNRAAAHLTWPRWTTTSPRCRDRSRTRWRRRSSTRSAPTARSSAIELHATGSGSEGIVHVIGPELGITQPGKTIVCGDSQRRPTAPSARSRSGSAPPRSSTCSRRRRSTAPPEDDAARVRRRAAAGPHRQGHDPRGDRPGRGRRRRRLRRRVRRRRGPRASRWSSA